jgi:hypothetical protein
MSNGDDTDDTDETDSNGVTEDVDDGDAETDAPDPSTEEGAESADDVAEAADTADDADDVADDADVEAGDEETAEEAEGSADTDDATEDGDATAEDAEDTDEATGEADESAEDADDESADEADESAEDADDESADEADESADEADETEEEGLTAEPTEENLREALTAAEESLADAETEADLDVVETKLDNIESGLAAADLPEPDEDDEDADDPRAEIESALEDLRADLEEARGPYGEDVVAAIDEAKSTIEDTRWTEQGEGEVAAAVETFADTVSETLDGSFAPDDESHEALQAALDAVSEAVTDAGFDADDDAEAIAALLEAADTLSADLDAAQEWDDLLVNEQLEAQGFYDCLGHYKDFPPEWSALKEWEKRGNVEMILLGLETFDSGFMEEHCLEAITRMGDPGAFDEMHQRAQKRGKPAIKALGKMGSGAEEAVDTLLDYVDADSDPQLQKVTFKALGEIGSEEATQALANKLVMENDNVRPYAARALGLIGDTRAVDPLTETLADDESDKVRAAAAWALRQIGTEDALEAAAAYTDAAAFTLQHEADLAAETLAATDADAPTA